MTNPAGVPVAGAKVTIVGTALTAESNEDGEFVILNVPSDEYIVKATHIDYQAYIIYDVLVSADRTTRLEMKLADLTLQTEEVVVIAERSAVDLKITSSQATLTTDQIEDLPVQNLEDVVNLQAGVVDGHFRGGRQGEVQYQVDGVSVNNAFDNSSSLNIDRSLLQEVQVISGTFDAEYGQAMSGVVNAVLKQGTEQFQVDAEAYTGGFFFPGRAEERRTDDDIHLLGTQNYQMTASGPLPLPATTYLVSGRYYSWDDYIYAQRRINPTDAYIEDDELVFVPQGDGEEFPLGYTDEWSGVVKLTNTAREGTKLNYQAIFNNRESRPTNYAFRYMPDALSIQRSYSISHGLDLSQTLGEQTFLDFSFRHNYYRYKDHLYEDAYDPRYDDPLQLQATPDGDYYYMGVQTNHYEQTTNTMIFKGSVVSQLNIENQVKTGFELSLPRVEFGNDVFLAYSNNELERYVDDPDYPRLLTRYPLMGAAYLQDQFENNDLVVRFGARLDYFDARSTIPSDPANPANAIEGAPESAPQETSVKASVSPRLGVAYPINDDAAIHVAYGHFRQFPSVSTMFTNSDYSILDELQASETNYAVMGNPDVKPETTVQYELGYKQALSSDLGFDATVFYKDIRDLLGVEFIDTYTGATYTRLTNVDFGHVTGVTLSLDDRAFGPVSVSLDYTWQQALGNASDPSETATRAAAGEDPRPRLVPFNWDQRHTVNLAVSMYRPGSFRASAIGRFASGQRYTPVTENAFGFGAATNSGRKPSAFLLDLRAEKFLDEEGRAGVFLRVFNALDQRYFNGFVFATTGSPYDARFPSQGELVSLANPTLLYPPRRIEFGVRWGWGGGW